MGDVGGFALATGLVVGLVIGILALFAWALIWALNTIFGLHIDFNFWTCTAIAVILIILGTLLGGRSK